MRLTERYRLLERLDDGGTMEVWRAWDELLDRPVAVKLLTPARAGLHRAFQQGVNRAAGLSAPALETIFDSDQTRDASGRLTSYLVTEFLDGATLADRLRDGPLTAYETADVCGRVASALDTAHAAGVTHGDLKPGRIMLLRDEVKLVDTGIGAVVRGARAPDEPGTGTVPARASAVAADIRALGAVIAACVAPGASEELSAIAARCLTEDPPPARRVAELLARDDAPPNRVFTASPAAASQAGGASRAGTAPPHRKGTLRPPAAPRRPVPRGARGARVAMLALLIAIPVTAAAAVLASAPRTPVSVAPPARTGAVPPPETAPSDRAPAAAPAGTRVRGALDRLRPIVSRGYASGEIRSDVAIDLNNVITNLQNDLTADQDVDVGSRVALLYEKIATRRRERALTPGLADELNRVLATIRA
ncbi:protein kinase domain-containing protein [Actinomadura monticuli]|uniref:Protein kinase domain-containing protein n=1 Tax=Actinomadura monticuli TaxID=3097367 RepID=A0ABV4QD95_9ACTN